MEDLGGNERTEIEGIQEAIQPILDILLNPIKLDQEEGQVGLRPTHLLDEIQSGVESSGEIELERDCKKLQVDKLDTVIAKMTERGEVGKTRVAEKGKEKGKKKQRVKMITEDYDVIVTYIENPEHYRDITGVEYGEDETFGDEEGKYLDKQVEAEVRLMSLYDYKKEYHDRYQELRMRNPEC
ncbi:hypothetical protein R1flu_010237 [Riccia fluitans]|uniref:Uncharacterized protein n=1 Tax=Riccia fluitans TaxID=41844 RepID=A0ABD1Z569_9MARC